MQARPKTVTSFIVTAKLAGLKLLAKYHTFESDYGDIDMGQEWGVAATYPFANYYSVGVKYAALVALMRVMISQMTPINYG